MILQELTAAQAPRIASSILGKRSFLPWNRRSRFISFMRMVEVSQDLVIPWCFANLRAQYVWHLAANGSRAASAPQSLDHGSKNVRHGVGGLAPPRKASKPSKTKSEESIRPAPTNPSWRKRVRIYSNGWNCCFILSCQMLPSLHMNAQPPPALFQRFAYSPSWDSRLWQTVVVQRAKRPLPARAHAHKLTSGLLSTNITSYYIHLHESYFEFQSQPSSCVQVQLNHPANAHAHLRANSCLHPAASQDASPNVLTIDMWNHHLGRRWQVIIWYRMLVPEFPI